MKKLAKVLSLLIAVAMLCSLFAGCKPTYTVTYYNGTEKIAELPVKEGKTVATELDGWFTDGDFFTSAEDYALATDDDAENDPEPYDVETAVTGNLSLYGTFVSKGLVTGDGHTQSLAVSVFPTVWNMFVYQTATDSDLMGYLMDGFYTFDYNETKDGYKLVPAMAVGDPVDVTADYVGEQWGIAEGEAHRAWKITIRDDLKWEDGTAIKAQDFVESAKRLLDPKAQNSRADDYMYAGDFVVHNAQNYLYQGQEGVFPATDIMSTADYSTDKDDILYFALGNTAQNTELLDCEGVNYFRTSFGFPESYDAAACAKYVKDYYLPDLDLEIVASMEGKTLKEIRADEKMNEQFMMLWGDDFWGSVPGEEIHFCLAEGAFPAVDFANVGVKAVSDTELVYILDQELKGFYLLYNLTGSQLVPLDLYDSCASENNGVYTNSFGTSVETTKSYGPFKLTYFQKDKSYKLEKNPHWYGYKDAANDPTLYQTDAIQVTRVVNDSTRLQMFLSGQLDSYGLTVNDMEEYQMSDHTYYTTDASTFFMALNPNKTALEEQQKLAGENINKTILTIKEFRQALSFSLDRAAFALATSPTNNAAFGVFSSIIIANPETGLAYRTTEEAKDALIAFWGLGDDIGEGKLYADKDAAIASITGYDLEGGKKLFDAAYDKAIADGLMDADDKIEIKIGLPSATAAFYVNGYDFLVNNYTEAVKGTKLEGKLTFSKDDTIGNGFGDALRNNQVDLLFGVGFTGSTLNPYGLVSVYSGNDESLRYDKGWDTTLVDVEVTLSTLEEGVTDTYTASLDAWTQILGGKSGAVLSSKGASVEVKLDGEDYETKTPILAAIEKAVLEQYDMIPLIDDSSAHLKGMKIKYYTEEYIYGVGRGGLKYMTYNYTDSEWAAFVAENGGVLNYK